MGQMFYYLDMKRILVTTDFSCHSKHTIDYVLNFLCETQIPCQLLLVNTYMVQQTDPKQVILLNDELKKKSKEGLEREREEAMKKVTNPRISIDVISHMGSLKNIIMQMLKTDKMDLVAMGKDGGKNVETIAALLKQQQCPLLITY